MAEKPKSLPAYIQRLSILVAEQNPALQKSIVETLQNGGANRVESAAKGGEVWQIWKRQKGIDVFVCASNLPEMGGLEILTRIRADKDAVTQPAFLLLGAVNNKEAINEALDKGADVFLAKPFSTDDLIPRVVEAVECRKQISGAKTFGSGSIEDELLKARLPVQLVFERFATEVECEKLTQEKCVIRVSNNYGLGTQLNLRFSRPGAGDGDYFKAIKGIVMKTERVPHEIGIFLLHVHFSGRVRAEHGIDQWLRMEEASAPPS